MHNGKVTFYVLCKRSVVAKCEPHVRYSENQKRRKNSTRATQKSWYFTLLVETSRVWFVETPCTQSRTTLYPSYSIYTVYITLYIYSVNRDTWGYKDESSSHKYGVSDWAHSKGEGQVCFLFCMIIFLNNQMDSPVSWLMNQYEHH